MEFRIDVSLQVYNVSFPCTFVMCDELIFIFIYLEYGADRHDGITDLSEFSL